MPDGFVIGQDRARADSPTAPTRISAGPLVAVINASAAGMRGNRRREIVRAFRHGLGFSSDRIIEAPGTELVKALREAARRRPQAVAVVGGDGAARTAMEVLTPLGVPVAPLPGGTLNRLSATVFGDRDVFDLVKELPRGRPGWISGGAIGPHRFFVASGFGALMRLNGVRERLRRGRFAEAWERWRALSPGLFNAPVLLGRAERPVSCALIGVGPLDAAFGLRPPQGREAFEVASGAWANLAQAVAVAPSVLLGGWRRRADVHAAVAHTVHLRSASGVIPALLDGEPVELPDACVVEFVQRCGLIWSRNGDGHGYSANDRPY